MKRIGYVIEEIVQMGNLEEAFDTVVRGTKRKQSREGRWLIANRESFLRGVAAEISSGHIELGKSHETVIVEAGKERRLQIFTMKARIKVAAVMIPVDRHLRKRYIRATASSIKGRGLHDLKAYIERDIRQDPYGTMYGYKFDISKCYDTVIHDFVRYALGRIFKDKKLLAIFDQFLAAFEHSAFEAMYAEGVGLSMGLRSSQGFLNTLLSEFLDHYLKDRYRVKHDYRYCDDGLTLNGMKRVLWKHHDIVHERVEAIGQKVKPNDRVFPITEGLDFLGYVIYPTHTLMRKRVKKSFARKLHKVKSRKRRQELVASFYGMAKHANCRHLMKKLLTIKEMKKFSELGVSYTPLDGKKRFSGEIVRLGAIVNKEIEVHDFERNVKTAHGDERYLISFRDKSNGEFGKFFTNSEEMKSILESLSKMDDAFPFETVIRSEIYAGGKTKYKFT
jgi:hypothetical protein